LQARVEQASQALAASLDAGKGSGWTAEQIFQEFKSHTESVVTKSNSIMTQQLGETVHLLVERLDQSNQIQFGRHNERLNGHEQSIVELQRLVAQLQVDLNSGKTATVTEQSAAGVRAAVGRTDHGWEGEADPTVLRGFCHNMVTKEGFRAGTAEWLHNIGMDEGVAYRIGGAADILDQNWDLQFLGSVEEATKKCRQAHSALKLSRTQWLQIWIQGPTGHWIQCHISADKNGKQRATEISTKKAAEVLARHINEEEFGPLFAMKPEGGIFVNWSPLVLVAPMQNGSVQLQWSEDQVLHCRVNKDLVTSELDAVLSSAGGGAGLRARLSQTRWSP